MPVRITGFLEVILNMLRAVFFFIIFLNTDHHQKAYWKTIRFSGLAQGTTYSITYYAADSVVLKSQVDSILKRLDSSFSLYHSNSLINRFNNSVRGSKIDSHFFNVAEKAMLVYQETNGLFDITVKPLVQAWGFGAIKSDSMPSGKKIEAIKKCIGANRLTLGRNYLFKKESCVQIDMNGIAQGYSVDVIADFLESKGVKNYLVELGGEIRVEGRKQPSGEKMKIGIESPDDDGFSNHPVQKVVTIESGAITTSGSYRNYYKSNEKKVSHIINPRTGYPVQNELVSVTVFAKNAITADAYDNALMLMGLKSALQFVEKRRDISAYFIYRDRSGNIRDTASFRFKKLLNP